MYNCSKSSNCHENIIQPISKSEKLTKPNRSNILNLLISIRKITTFLSGLALPSDQIADCFRLERQIPWHQEASNTRSMTNRESMQCSEVVMQLQRMCSRPRVAFETFEKSFPEPSSAAASKFRLRELD